MSTNEIQTPLTPKDEVGQVGIDGFGQLMYWSAPNSYGHRSGHIVHDIRGKTCELCGREWEPTAKSWVDQYYHSSYHVLLHESCYIRYLSFVQRADWYRALWAARIRFDGLHQIPNEYGGAWNTPWYTTRLLDHKAVLKLGRRKRVNVIKITFDYPHPDAYGRLLILFSGEDVTQDGDGETSFYVHSWSGEKDREYLKKIAEALGDDGKLKGGFVSAGVQKFAL